MDKTIEERAKEWYPKGIGVFTTEGAELLQKAYNRGATEQKAIDTNKACEWLRSHIDQDFVYATQGYRSTEGFIDDFRKAMMDKTE